MVIFSLYFVCSLYWSIKYKELMTTTLYHQLYLGGIGCGNGFPGWYTKVSYHLDWINCIIEMSDLFNGNRKKVEQACNRRAQHRDIKEGGFQPWQDPIFCDL